MDVKQYYVARYNKIFAYWLLIYALALINVDIHLVFYYNRYYNISDLHSLNSDSLGRPCGYLLR